MTARIRGYHWTGIVVAVWLLIYPGLLIVNHLTLRTNGYDLSVFDYALWSSLHGRLGYVPFMHQSLFAQHFMPTLLTILPVYAVWSSPILLIALQLTSILIAALLLSRFASEQLPPILSAAFVAAFLFSRRSHSAEISVFYVGVLEPMLVIALVLAAARRHWRTYFLLLILALGCKEDMALYLGMFGLLLVARQPSRRAGVVTAVVCAVWLAGAVLVAIPGVRRASGLDARNPFIEARYGQSGEAGGVGLAVAAIHRVVSGKSVAKFITLSGAVLFTAWAAPEWLAIVLPGVALNLSVKSGTLQAGLTGHYLWPILPWLFIAGIVGTGRMIRRWPRLTPWIAAALFLSTIVDAPIRSALLRHPWTDLPAAAEVRHELQRLPPDAAVLAQPNLIPQIAHRWNVEALAPDDSPSASSDYVVVSTMGDLWPFTESRLQNMTARLRTEPAFDETSSGSLTVFRRIAGR